MQLEVQATYCSVECVATCEKKLNIDARQETRTQTMIKHFSQRTCHSRSPRLFPAIG
jgi:hypothetical protein